MLPIWARAVVWFAVAAHCAWLLITGSTGSVLFTVAFALTGALAAFDLFLILTRGKDTL